MFKIAILGCENSHAKNFLELIQKGEYPEIEVLGVFSEELEAAQKLNEQFGVPVLSSYDEMVGKLDGLMITARHGDNHYKYAKPYMNDHIPMFIDKPITCSEEEAVAFMREAREKGIRFCGGSTCAALKETLELAEFARSEAVGSVCGGSVVAPLHPSSPYGGFYFYAQHLVEIMTTIFGEDIKSVQADTKGKVTTYFANYENYHVTGTYVEGVKYYSASVIGSLELQEKHLIFTPQSFRHEMNDMLALLKGEPMKKTYESFITPVFVMNAIIRSLKSGREEKLNPIEI